jgi:hypothetical protein
MRRRIALVVLALHGLFVWLLVMGFRHQPREIPELPQFVSIWMDPPLEEVSPPPEITPRQEPSPPERTVTRRQPTAPVTAPLVPAVPVTPVAPVPESTAPAAVPTLPADWAERAALAAKRTGERLANPGGESFSPPPKTIAKPCVPKKKSMEWKGEENPGLHLQNGFPVWIVGNCTITLGFFACTGDTPPNEHLFDDMKDPNRSRSSVPDVKVCD